jgi:hypothetical protein
VIREHLMKAHPERDGAFRWRGDGVSRIEGLSDVVLLCLVVFFVYPLKFLFETFIAMWLGPVGWLLGSRALMEQAVAAWNALERSQWPLLMIVFGAAYFAIFGVFALLHRHALRCADALALDDLERHETRFAIVSDGVNMGVAARSVAVTLAVAYGLGPGAVPNDRMGGTEGFGALLGGVVYPFTGLFLSLVSRPHRRRRAELLAARHAAPASPT